MGIEVEEIGSIGIGKSINPFFWFGKKKSSSRRKKSSQNRRRKIKHRTSPKGKLRRHKTKHRGGKAIHYTKHGQPYRIMADGKARFIKKKKR